MNYLQSNWDMSKIWFDFGSFCFAFVVHCFDEKTSRTLKFELIWWKWNGDGRTLKWCQTIFESEKMLFISLLSPANMIGITNAQHGVPIDWFCSDCGKASLSSGSFATGTRPQHLATFFKQWPCYSTICVAFVNDGWMTTFSGNNFRKNCVFWKFNAHIHKF